MPLLEGQPGPFQLELGLSYCQLPSPVRAHTHTLSRTLAGMHTLSRGCYGGGARVKRIFHICVSCFKRFLSCHKKKEKKREVLSEIDPALKSIGQKDVRMLMAVSLRGGLLKNLYVNA